MMGIVNCLKKEKKEGESMFVDIKDVRCMAIAIFLKHLLISWVFYMMHIIIHY